MRWLESTYKEKARAWVGFNEPVSHRITAAADILLMPSRFEPCGLNQLYAMRYGTVPVAHATGGLKDTVLNYDPFAGVCWGYSAVGLSRAAAAAAAAVQASMPAAWNCWFCSKKRCTCQQLGTRLPSVTQAQPACHPQVRHDFDIL